MCTPDGVKLSNLVRELILFIGAEMWPEQKFWWKNANAGVDADTDASAQTDAETDINIDKKANGNPETDARAGTVPLLNFVER